MVLAAKRPVNDKIGNHLERYSSLDAGQNTRRCSQQAQIETMQTFPVRLGNLPTHYQKLKIEKYRKSP